MLLLDSSQLPPEAYLCSPPAAYQGVSLAPCHRCWKAPSGLRSCPAPSSSGGHCCCEGLRWGAELCPSQLQASLCLHERFQAPLCSPSREVAALKASVLFPGGAASLPGHTAIAWAHCSASPRGRGGSGAVCLAAAPGLAVPVLSASLWLTTKGFPEQAPACSQQGRCRSCLHCLCPRRVGMPAWRSTRARHGAGHKLRGVSSVERDVLDQAKPCSGSSFALHKGKPANHHCFCQGWCQTG